MFEKKSTHRLERKEPSFGSNNSANMSMEEEVDTFRERIQNIE